MMTTETSQQIEKFVNYVHSFYGASSDLYPMGATKPQIRMATYILIDRGDDVAFDTIDREKVRDILIERLGLLPTEKYVAFRISLAKKKAAAAEAIIQSRTRRIAMFYVDHIGHPYAICAVSFKTLEAAMAYARRSCADAMLTRVWGNANNLICALNPSDKEITANA